MNTIDLTQIWPGWMIEGAPLGVGSFGSVYKAVRRDNGVESYAAVKIISILKGASIVDPQELVNGCVGEIRLMESLKGIQNIVSVEDYLVIPKPEDAGWDIFIRMELLTPLTAYVKNRPLSQHEVIKLGTDICTALEVCGKKGIIHRDIKPENIFVNEFGDFKLGDFGIARKLEKGMNNLSIKGTINYMAPEVANSKDYDARVDTYSLGLVLYQYLNRNRLPFFSVKGQTITAAEAESAPKKRLQGEKLPPPIDASQKMAEVVLKACAYNPNARYQDASLMKEALQSVMDGTAVKTKRRKAWPGILAAVLIMALLGGGAALYFTGILGQLIPGLPGFGEKTPQETTESTSSPEELEREAIAAVITYAETLMRTDDLEGAIAAIVRGLEDHPDSADLNAKLAEYETALADRTRAASLESAQGLANNQEFLAAIALLEDAMATQGEHPDFIAAMESYRAEYHRILKADTMTEANRLAADEAYLEAVHLIDEALAVLGQDSDLLSRRSELEGYYVSLIVKQADELLLRESFDNAETLVNEAIKQFPNNEQLLGEAQRIQNARPVYLLDVVTPYKKADHYNAGSIVSMGGRNYLHGFTVMGYGDYNKGNRVYFNLDGKYSLISFTAGIVADRGQTVTFLFHADGELIYKITMKKGEMPKNHTINLVGCKQLMISVSDGTSSIDKSGTYGLADIMVKRNISNQGTQKAQLNSNQVYLLEEMQPYKYSSHYQDSTSLSMGGLYYGHGFSCMGYGSYDVGNEFYFNLDGDYSKMTFTSGIVLDRNLDVEFTFYADGKRIYQFEMEPAQLATTHTINVEGCKQLRITVYDGKDKSDVSGTYGIGDIIMDKSESYSNAGTEKTLTEGQHYLLDVVKPHSTPTRYDDSSMLNMGGKHYYHGYSCMGYGDYGKGNMTKFQLDGKYSELTFTSGVILDRDERVTIRVESNGKKIYEYVMQKGDLPVEHTVNIEGCKELTICVYDRQSGADRSGTYGIANIIVTEAPPPTETTE